MGAMGVSGRVGIILLVIAFLAPCFLIAMPVASSSTISSDPGKTLAATQYNPSALFKPGICFNDYSWAIRVDPDARDFAIGDLNGDGLKDLVIISNQTDPICIYNRTMGGSFNPVPWRLYSPGVTDVRSIAIGDLLGKDGKNDIAVSCYNDSSGQGNICIFNQSNNFSPMILPLVGTDPSEITTGHFNNNTDNCIAVVSRGVPNLVDIWKYPFRSFTLDHRFHIISSSPTFTNSELITSGDINGDGRDDIVIGNGSGSNVYIMLQPTSWGLSWSTSTKLIFGQASDVELADVLGNDRNDLIFANAANVGGSSYVYVYRNNGTGFDPSPQTPTKVYLGLGSVAIGEFSGAPGIDLLTLCKSSANASAYFRNSVSAWYGSSPNLTFPVGTTPLKAIVDRSITGLEGIFILSQGASGEPSSIAFFDASSYLKGSADKNLFTGSKSVGEMATGRMSNGNVVLTSVLSSSNEVVVYECNTSKTRVLYTGSDPISVCMGRFNLDSNDDLAVLNSATGIVSIYNGSTLFTTSYPIKNITLPFTGGYVISAKSVRGDGFDDLAITHDTGIYILYCLENWQCFSVSSSESLGVGINGARKALSWGDYNGNGVSSDIAVLNSATDTVEIYIYKSTGGPSDHYENMPSANLTDTGKHFLALAVGDFGITNEPGNVDRTDIAVLAQGGEVLIYLQPNFGFEAFTFPTPNKIIELSKGAKTISAGDLNDDGLDDLLIGYSTLPQLSVFLQIKSLTFTNPFNFTSGAEASAILAKDVNGDGRTDILCSSPGSYSISIWFQNNLAPIAMISGPAYQYVGVNAIFSGAFSQDSYSDVGSLNYTWAFGDGHAGYGKTVSHTYENNITFTVVLNVTDRGGLNNASKWNIKILQTYPCANFTIWPQIPPEGTWVFFNDTSEPSNISNSSIQSWQWEFDGKTGNSTNDARQRFGAGEHTVTLTVWDARGVSNSTALRYFNVTKVLPVADFNCGNAKVGANAYFNSTSSTAWTLIGRYRWDFGDDNVTNGTESNVSHIFDMKGWYKIVLNITDLQGYSAEKAQWLYVNATPPQVSFTLNGISIEGALTKFNLTTFSFNPIVSWNWSYDDNRTWYLTNNSQTGTNHTFSNNGSYWVSVNVTEKDGAWSIVGLLVNVQDTTPEILRFWSAAGATYNMDQNVSFWVWAIQTYKPITKYEWNFNYNSGGSWIPSSPFLTNHTSWTFTKPGTYYVKVRVWDNNGFVESISWLEIQVNDVAPVAHFSYHNSTQTSGRILFDATLSIDTPSDIASLNFSWNFGDGSGWTAFATGNKTVSHEFATDSNYTVTLLARDQWNLDSAPFRVSILVDRTPPLVVMGSTGRNATAGQAIIISARVTDQFGVRQVILEYRVSDGSWINVSMTPANEPETYYGQIPSQLAKTNVSYMIRATDTNNNTYSTQIFQLNIEATSPQDISAEDLALFAIVAIIAIALSILLIRNAMVPVDEVFIIYNDGRLMAHQTRRLKPGMDDEILSSMLVAIQGFVKDSFKDESSTHLQRLDFGEKKILVERGDSFYLAVVLHSQRAGNVPHRMQGVIEDIHREYGQALKDWDGDLEKVRGVKDQTDRLFKTPMPLALAALSKEKPVDANKCQACGQAVLLDQTICPACGAELSVSNLDKIEGVAKGPDERKGEEK